MLLGSIIAVIVFLFGAMVLFKRIQFIKQASLGSIHGEFKDFLSFSIILFSFMAVIYVRCEK